MATEHLLVPALASQAGVRAISGAVQALPGVRLVSVDVAGRRVRVEHDGRTQLEAIILAIRAAGYPDVAVLV